MNARKRRKVRRAVAAALTGLTVVGAVLTDVEVTVFEDGSLRATACVAGFPCDDQ